MTQKVHNVISIKAEIAIVCDPGDPANMLTQVGKADELRSLIRKTGGLISSWSVNFGRMKMGYDVAEAEPASE